MLRLQLLASIPFLILLLVANGSASSSSPTGRNTSIQKLAQWAQEEGIVMHPSLRFKEYKSDDGDDSNWGLELEEPVAPGTVLMTVPRKLILDANVLKQDANLQDPQTIAAALGDHSLHEKNFWIVRRLWQLCVDSSNNKWKPWISAMPKAFTRFTPQEQDCLPFYAKYAAQYQDAKLESFARAMKALGDNDYDPQEFLWAFQAVNSRFWTTAPPKDSKAEPTTELVPIGDMFNHREPPNVRVESHQEGSVEFIYSGDALAGENNRDLYITYGQPSNPHRFLVIFGFVPTDTPTMWSHLTLADNPFAADVSNMVFAAQDGDTSRPIINKTVWDAILFALMDPDDKHTKPTYTTERHNQRHVREVTLDVLQNHVHKNLQELEECRTKLERLGSASKNLELLKQHNAFVTKTFARVSKHLATGTYTIE